MMLKTVTLQEANGLLSLVRERFSHIHLLIDRLHDLQSQPSRRPHKSLVFDVKDELIHLVMRKDRNKKRAARTKKMALIENLIAEEIHNLAKLGVVVGACFRLMWIFYLSTKVGPCIFVGMAAKMISSTGTFSMINHRGARPFSMTT